jgi:hypothetical protein
MPGRHLSPDQDRQQENLIKRVETLERRVREGNTGPSTQGSFALATATSIPGSVDDGAAYTPTWAETERVGSGLEVTSTGITAREAGIYIATYVCAMNAGASRPYQMWNRLHFGSYAPVYQLVSLTAAPMETEDIIGSWWTAPGFPGRLNVGEQVFGASIAVGAAWAPAGGDQTPRLAVAQIARI